MRRKALVFLPVVVLAGAMICHLAASQPEPIVYDGVPTGIAWHGILKDGVAEAKATNRPILLVSAAPQCAGVPGMW